jgi:hypothetical protein
MAARNRLVLVRFVFIEDNQIFGIQVVSRAGLDIF